MPVYVDYVVVGAGGDFVPLHVATLPLRLPVTLILHFFIYLFTFPLFTLQLPRTLRIYAAVTDVDYVTDSRLFVTRYRLHWCCCCILLFIYTFSAWLLNGFGNLPVGLLVWMVPVVRYVVGRCAFGCCRTPHDLWLLRTRTPLYTVYVPGRSTHAHLCHGYFGYLYTRLLLVGTRLPTLPVTDGTDRLLRCLIAALALVDYVVGCSIHCRCGCVDLLLGGRYLPTPVGGWI